MPRHAPPPASAGLYRRYRFAGWSFDPVNHLLTHDDNRQVHLNPSQTILLATLCAAPFTPLSREQLSTALGHEYFASDRLIDVLVSQIRQRLGRQVDGSHAIRSVRSVGYVLVCPVDAS